MLRNRGGDESISTSPLLSPQFDTQGGATSGGQMAGRYGPMRYARLGGGRHGA